MAQHVEIIGAGPSGASLAYFLSRYGVSTRVYESNEAPGWRPCAWGVPRQIEKYIELPKEVILNYIDEIELYLDRSGLYSAEFRGGWGYIIDKPRWLAHLLEKSGAEVHFKRLVDINRILSSVRDEETITVIAAGKSWAPPTVLRLNALEYVLKADGWPGNKIEFWFDSSFVGYTWIFPRGEGTVSVGVGAFKDFNFLREYLDVFTRRHGKLGGSRKLLVRGDSLVVSGLNTKRAVLKKNVYAVGEAIGAVFPITGEGIRPSVITSYALSRALRFNGDYVRELKETGLFLAMNLHKMILWTALNSTPEERAYLLSSMPLEKSVALATGEFKREDIESSFPFLSEVLNTIESEEIALEELSPNLNMGPAKR